jgi:putative phosphotransacetylase
MQRTVLIETSARHVHVSREALDVLYGEGYELTPKKDLSQPGQYACEERVQVIGPKGSFPAVSILGPIRPSTQVEISATDTRAHRDYRPDSCERGHHRQRLRVQTRRSQRHL